MTKGYNGYLVSKRDRTNILGMFPPKYKRVIAHHITHEYGVSESLPPETNQATIVGYADSEDGLEALVVEINGSSTRSDGKIYHITLSLDPAKYSPKDSNTLIGSGYEKTDPMIINVEPKFFPLK